MWSTLLNISRTLFNKKGLLFAFLTAVFFFFTLPCIHVDFDSACFQKACKRHWPYAGESPMGFLIFEMLPDHHGGVESKHIASSDVVCPPDERDRQEVREKHMIMMMTFIFPLACLVGCCCSVCDPTHLFLFANVSKMMEHKIFKPVSKVMME